MKPYFLTFTLLLLIFLGAGPLESCAQTASSEDKGQTAYTLYPVTGFAITMMETIPYLSWQSPELPGGGVPPGFVGYKIYRDGDSLIFLSNPASTFYYDADPLEPGLRIYAITAYYDLTSYGYPGLFEESEAVEDSVYITSCPLPFEETWDQACFEYHDWVFNPSQGNWVISTLHGNPAPTAVFEGSTALSAYSHRLCSKHFVSATYFCADIVLEFDYKLEDVAAGSTEKLFVEVEYDDSWHTLLELTNNGSTDWIHQVIQIPDVYPFNSQLGFRAEGESSSNISGWMLDNILYDARCHPPLNTSLDFSGGNMVTLTWDPPCDLPSTDSSFFTYYVYRTDSSGLPPYEAIASEITDTFFNNYLEPGQLGGHFRYYIVAEHVYNDGYYNMGVCYGYGDTVSYIPQLGIMDISSLGPVIYPNPAADRVTINCPGPSQEIRIIDCLGNTILDRKTMGLDKLFLNVSSWPPGVYLVKIRSAGNVIVKKIAVNK